MRAVEVDRGREGEVADARLQVEAELAHAFGRGLVEVLEAGHPERAVLVVGAGAHVAADVGVAAFAVEDAARRRDLERRSSQSVSRHRGPPAPPAGTGKSNSARRVLPRELADVVGGEAVELVAEDRLGVGPGAVLVRVVGLEADVVDADAVALLEPRPVLDGAEPEVALQHLGRGEVDALPRAVHVLVALDVVEPVEQTGDPADAALGEADAQVGEAHREARVEPVDRGEHRPAEEQHADGVGRRVRRRGRRARRRADVEAHDGAGLGARGEERIPVAGVQRRQPEALRQLGERDARGSRAPRWPRTSAAARSGSSSHGSWHGMMRPGCVPAHSSRCQSLAARTTASARSGSLTPSW